MKRQILAFLMLCLGFTAMAQQITKYEYWLDTGHAERTIHPTGTGSLEFTIDVGNLCHGLHALNFRAQDSEGRWSSPSSSYFYCIDMESTSQGVSQYEYWLDQNAAERVTANGQGSAINLDVDISTLLTGLHTFSFRYKDGMEHWSAPQTSYFLVPQRQNGSDIQNTYEYWIDNKQGEKVQVKGYNGVIDLSLDVNTLPTGLHSLSFRATDGNGIWSAPQTSYFLVPIRQNGSDIQNTYEYWIDNKQGEKVQVKGYNGVIDLSLDVNTLPTGLHSLSFRATDQNGIWSAPQTSYFLVPIRQNGSDIQNTYEYWLDNKQGEKVQVKGYNGVIDLSLDVNTLPTGLHSLSFRATDQNGIWSAPQTSYFYIPVDMNVNQNIKAYCYWFNDAFENRITETVSPAVIPFTLDAKLTASDVVTDITPENITMADDGEGHMKLATKNLLHTQFCTEDGRWTGFSVDTFAVVINVPEVDLTSFIKNPDASSKWNGWTTEGSTIGIYSSQTWQDGDNYFRLGNTSKNEWNSSMQQTITGLPAGTYILSAKGRAAEGVEMEISVNGFTDTFPATGTAGGELTNGWTERSLIFTTDGQPFVIKVSGSANSSGKWMDIADFRLTYSNVSNASLTVNMPETADMTIYQNLKLWLTSVSSKLSVTTSNAHNYNFYGLTAGVAYNLMLTNRYGQTIAQKDSIMIAEGENSITLSDLMQLCNVEAAVTDLANNNLTDKVRIAWFMKDGTPVSDDSSITGLASGTKLLCNVTLGDSLGCIYREVKEQEYLLTKGDNKFTISLAPIEKASIIGKVLAEDGNTNPYATISVTEWLNGRYSKTLSVRTDSKGAFTLDCHQDSLHITIASDGYLDCIVDTVCASTAIDLGQLYLKEITGIVITPRLNYRNATEEGETEDTIFYSNADNVDYFVTNLSTGSAVNDIKVQSGTIIAKSGVNVGDKLSVRIHSRKGDFEDATAETIVAEDETAEVVFNIVEKGGLKASYEFSGNNEDIAMLYNTDGALVSREFYNGNSCTFSHLSDGHYTLLSMGKMLMMDAILNLSDLSAIGLTEGTDYVLSNVEIKAGKITIINNENIPQIDETLFYYTGTNTSFSANKSSVVVGNYITLTGHLDFKEEYADDVDDLSLVVDLPEGMEYVQGSAIIGTTLAPCSVDGKRLTISLNRNNYKERIRFCVVPTKGGTMMPSAYVAFSLDDEVVQPIGSATVTAKNMSISVPSTVAKPEITVSGVAVPYSHVTVYDGTTLIGQVAAKADGNWMVKGEFIEPYNLSTHSVYANVVTPQEISMNTEVVNVLYDKNAIEVKTVTMINTAHPAGNLNLCEYKTVFDFQNPSQESPVYWYWSSYPDFTFIVDFTNNDTTVVKNVMLYVYTSDDNYEILFPSYDEKKDAFVASHKFTSSSSLPVNVNVEFAIEKNTLMDCRQIDEMYNVLEEERQNYEVDKQEAERKAKELDQYALTDEDDIEDYLTNKLPLYLSKYKELYGVDIPDDEDDPYSGMTPEEFFKKTEEEDVEDEKVLAEISAELDGLDEFYSNGPYFKAEQDVCDGKATVTIETRPNDKTEQQLQEEGFQRISEDGGTVIYERKGESSHETVDVTHNVYSNRKVTFHNESYGWNQLLADIYIQVLTSEQHIKFVTDKIKNSYAYPNKLRISTLNRLRYVRKISYGNNLSENEKVLIKETIKMYQNKIQKIDELYFKGQHVIDDFKRIKGIERIAKYTSITASSVFNALNVYTNLEKFRKFKGLTNISVPYCVYSQDPNIAANIDEKMINLVKEINYWVGVQPINDALFFTAGAAFMLLTGPVGLVVALSAGVALSCFSDCMLNNRINDLSSKATAIKWEMIQATAKYCSRDELRKLVQQAFDIPLNLPTPDAQFVLDPSGYVYEAVSSNRLEGVTATIYQKVTTEDMYGDKHDEIVKWDAEPYSQRNPVKTDVNGLYSWDVPDGLWQVKFEKDGYETVYSDWLPVPPPQLDINVPMYQSVQPEVTGARGFESGVDFTFSKYMRPATFAEGTVTLSHDGKPVSGQLKMLNIEKEPLDGVEYVSHIKFVPDQSLNVGDEVTLTISREVKSYCGVTMEKDYTATLVIQPEINEIAVDSVVNVGYGSNSVIEVSVLPADAAKGKMLRLQNNTPSILVTDVTDFTLDDDGKTKIPIAGALPGTGALQLSVDGSDISVEVKVNVVTISTKVAAPESSIPSGSTVEKGSLILLSCATEGATIYYTLDGSCPCNEATRLVYKEPIIINETVTIKAMSVAPDMTESDVVEFTYIVDVVDSINDVTIDETIKIYPLPVRNKLNITAGGKIIKSVTLANINGSTVMSALKPVSHVTFDVSSLITGIYIINIETEDKTYSRKIIKVE